MSSLVSSCSDPAGTRDSERLSTVQRTAHHSHEATSFSCLLVYPLELPVSQREVGVHRGGVVLRHHALLGREVALVTGGNRVAPLARHVRIVGVLGALAAHMQRGLLAVAAVDRQHPEYALLSRWLVKCGRSTKHIEYIVEWLLLTELA